MPDERTEELKLHPIVSLSKYFSTWASYMRTEFDKIGIAESTEWNEPPSVRMFMFMSFLVRHTLHRGRRVARAWIERSGNRGTSEVSSNVETLKRYRHGVYHFQRAYFDQRYMPFITTAGSVQWVRGRCTPRSFGSSKSGSVRRILMARPKRFRSTPSDLPLFTT